MSLSHRARRLQSSPSAIMVGHMTCAEDPYSLSNPKGYLNFGTAENHLMSDLLLPKLNEPTIIEKEHIQYNALYGMEDIRTIITNFFENYLNLKNLNPDNLVIQTGVSAICESLSFALFDEGDKILIPTPYYTGFDHDFTKRFGCQFEPVHLKAENNFRHDIENFKQAFTGSSEKESIKAVLLTHPHNPTGEVLTESLMDEIILFCQDNNLELISDEIYALSIHDGRKHISLYQKAKNAGIKTHFLYGMAKDFCLAGLKVGFFYTDDQELLGSMQNLSYFHPVSTQTQILIGNLLNDHNFLNRYIPQNQKRLAEIPHLLNSQLPMFDFLPTNAGLFTLLDLTQYCKTFEQEDEYFKKFLNYIKVNMTPGMALGLDKPGYFRVCFGRTKEEILEFIIRMRKFHENELN